MNIHQTANNIYPGNRIGRGEKGRNSFYFSLYTVRTFQMKNMYYIYNIKANKD